MESNCWKIQGAIVGFHPDMLRFCSMHSANLGLNLQANGCSLSVLLDRGRFGDPQQTDQDTLLSTAYTEFCDWCRANSIYTSQSRFKLVMSGVDFIYLPGKAFNARVVTAWLSSVLTDLAIERPADMELNTTAACMHLPYKFIMPTLCRHTCTHTHTILKNTSYFTL